MINSLSNIPIQTKAYQHKNNNLLFKNVAGFDEFVLHDKIPVTYKGGRAFLETNIEQIPDKKEGVLFVTKISDDKNKVLGSYKYQVHKFPKKIDSGYIETIDVYRRKGLGEIMRLASLMEFGRDVPHQEIG